MHTLVRLPLPLMLLFVLFAAAASAAPLAWDDTGLPLSFTWRFTLAPDGRIFAAGGDAIHASDDDGVSWQHVGDIGGFVNAARLAASPPGSLYVADFALGVYRSGDGGATWSGPLTTEGANGLAVTPGGVVLAGLTYTGNGRIHRSQDDGASWQGVDLPGSSHSFATECFAFAPGGAAYAGTIDGVYRSTDEGASWDAASNGLAGTNVRTMAVTPNGHAFALTTYSAMVDGLYRSTDEGLSWLPVGPTGLWFRAMAATGAGELFAVADASVRRSADEGASWEEAGSGFAPGEDLSDVLVTPGGHVLVGGYHVYRSTARVLDAGPPSPPSALALSPAAPNPCVGTTRVAFRLARRAAVDLAVFDLAGRRVATLAGGTIEAGEHARTLDASVLPTGLYLCRLRADGVTLTRRLVVNR